MFGRVCSGLKLRCSTWLLLLLGFLSKGLALNCYQCAAFSCTNELTICASAREFVWKQLPSFYHINEDLPQCPDPLNTEEWEKMKKLYPSTLPCQQIVEGEATCTLGRFRVTTLITESNVNLTAHGTVLGCARRELLTRVRDTLYDRPKKDNSFHQIRGCHLDETHSPVRNSLKHIFELEVCSKITDMCHEQNYCIDPELSEVKTFKDVEYDTSVPMSLFIWIAIGLGVLIGVVTILGIKYN